MTDNKQFSRMAAAMIAAWQCRRWSGAKPPCGESCECWQQSMVLAEAALWIGQDPNNMRRLTALIQPHAYQSILDGRM